MCALTSILCAVLLYLENRRHQTRLLFWSVICFSCLGINNTLLFADLVLLPTVDMSVIRTLPALFGFAVLLWGFIWDT
ncbi:MAG: DUF5985 family protein [Bdellovibrionia bacterium]